MGSRANAVPFGQLFAEIAAAPLGTEEAFNVGLVELTGGTDGFWKALEGKLIAKFPGISVDEFTALRDYIWFAKSERTLHPVEMRSFLLDLHRAMFLDSGFEVSPRVEKASPLSEISGDSREKAGRDIVNWMQRSLPVDLLTAVSEAPVECNHLTTQVDEILHSNFAEMHLHLGASMSFRQLWPCALAAIDSNQMPFDGLKSPNGHFNQGIGMATWLVKAAIARTVMACFLRSAYRKSGFESYIKALPDFQAIRGVGQAIREVLSDLTQPNTSARQYHSDEFRLLQNLFRKMQLHTTGPVTCPTSLRNADPIASLFKRELAAGDLYPEDLLVRRSLQYAHGAPASTGSRQNPRAGGSVDRTFARLFWQTIRVRCIFHQHLTQQHGVPGLVWFTRVYRRISPTRRGAILTGGKLWAAALTAGLERGLKSLEVRVAPENESHEILSEVQELADASRQINSALESGLPIRRADLRAESLPNGFPWKTPIQRDLVQKVSFETSLVLHFVKEREAGTQDTLSAFGLRSHENPGVASRNHYRYRDYYVRCRTKVDAIVQVLKSYPLTLQWIRGIDICNDELAMPTWVFATHFRKIIDASRETSAYLSHTLGLHVPPVRATAHVGEDFVHLLTGLRRIDEAIDMLDIREGSRIGHALALGKDPQQWASNSGPVTMDKLTRLHDLLWEWSVINELRSTPDSNRIHLVETESKKLIDDLFGHWPQLPTIYQLVRLRLDLTNEDFLTRSGFPDSIPHRSGGIGQFEDCDSARIDILRRYLSDELLFRRGRNVTLVNPNRTGDTLEALQDGLRRRVAARGILVEVNPSSNLVVARLNDLADHPMWRLSRPNYDDKVPEVSVCIGSDDPLVFATDLRQEYQRVADSLFSQGYSGQAIHHWLDKVRRNALGSRNTLSSVCYRRLRDLGPLASNVGR